MLLRSLSYVGYEVITAKDGTQGLNLALQKKPHLIILDVMLPGINGYKLCKRIKDVTPKIPILMLTAKDDVEDRVTGLDCGADDYLVKPFALKELMARMRALLRRFTISSNECTQYSDLRINNNTRQVWRDNREIQLTAKEYDLLSILLEHPKQVLTRDRLMDEIWGYDYEGESNVLEVYIGYLRQKLESCGEKRLIHTIRGVGYVLREQGD